MQLQLPPPPPGPGQSAWAAILDKIRQAFASAISQDEAAPRVIFRSPNGSTYAVTVDDTGTINVDAISGKERQV